MHTFIPSFPSTLQCANARCKEDLCKAALRCQKANREEEQLSSLGGLSSLGEEGGSSVMQDEGDKGFRTMLNSHNGTRMQYRN
jgi:hypothetical protein